MGRLRQSWIFPPAAVAVALGLAATAFADPTVALLASADPDYTRRKYEGSMPRQETYVFMQGNYYEGITVDRSIEKMPFRRIAEYLASELAKQWYIPTTDPATADLVIVVHWGTTRPHVSTQEMRAQTSTITDTSETAAGVEKRIAAYNEMNPSSPVPSLGGTGFDSPGMGSDATRQLEFDALEQLTDRIGGEMTAGSNVQLLGYGRNLRKFSTQLWAGEEERTLRSDLGSERYFIILKAYEAHPAVKTGGSRRPLWTMHLNISSPGNNFTTALTRMSVAAVDFFGRSTDEVRSVRPGIRQGQVVLRPLIIIGEAK